MNNETTGNTKKKYHAIQWAAEAYFTISRDIGDTDIQKEMHKDAFNRIKEKCKDNQIRTMLLNDANTEHYFTNLELEEIKNIV